MRFGPIPVPPSGSEPDKDNRLDLSEIASVYAPNASVQFVFLSLLQPLRAYHVSVLCSFVGLVRVDTRTPTNLTFLSSWR